MNSVLVWIWISEEKSLEIESDKNINEEEGLELKENVAYCSIQKIVAKPMES